MTVHRFETLDAVRGAAALLVLAHHLELRAGYGTHFLRHGYLAVDLFFMLSGFVIAYAYEQRLKSGLSFKAFAVARFIRLQPFILIGASLGVVAAALAGALFNYWWVAYALQIALVPIFRSHDNIYAFNGAQWSLLFEVAINLFYALTIRWMTTAVVVGMIIVNAIGLFIAAAAYGDLGVGWGTDNFIGAIPRAGFGFYMGVLLWRLWSADKLPRIALPWPLILLATGLIMGAASVGPWSVWPYADPLIVVLIMPPLVWLAACSPLTGKFSAVGLLAGALSYPVYALQGPIRSIIATLAGDPVKQSPALILSMAVAVIAISWVLLRFYDEPLRAWLRSRTKPARRAVTA